MMSEVAGSAANGLPVAFTTTYCRPSLPSYVLGTEPAAASSLNDHSSLPVFASNARKRLSSVAPTNTSPPAVAIGPPMPGRPVFCLSAGRLSVMPSGTFHAISPVFTLTATSSPQGGCEHGMFDALSLNRPAGRSDEYVPERPVSWFVPTTLGLSGPL